MTDLDRMISEQGDTVDHTPQNVVTARQQHRKRKRFFEADRGLDAATTEFDWPSFATTARALGGAGIEVASVSDWPLVEAALEQLEGPLLIELKLHPDEMPRMRV